MRMLPSFALAFALTLAALVIVGAACTADPNPPPSSGELAPGEPDFTLACWSGPADRCERAAVEAIARLPAGHRPVAVVAVHDALVDIEFSDGDGRMATRFGTAGDGRLEFGPWTESQVGAIRPSSGPAGGPIVRLTLGHCGLSSPIDVDGSFWDPHGAIDDDVALINASDGQFRRLGPNEAEFVTGASRVALRRHVGAKSPPGCD